MIPILRKHPRSADIAMEILGRKYLEDSDSWSLEIRWWNIGRCHKPWCMGVIQELTLPHEKYSEWQLMEFGKVQEVNETVHWEVPT